jgi:hypothetical protein
LRIAHQRAAAVFLRQSVVVARVRDAEFVPHIAGPRLKDALQFALEQRLVEIAGNW